MNEMNSDVDSADDDDGGRRFYLCCRPSVAG